VIDWDDAAASLERLLEHAARLVDGETDSQAPDPIDLQSITLSSTPDPATIDHVRALLTQVPDAVRALEEAKSVAASELDELNRHRTAATAYTRAPVAPAH
jgi:hypothetical protein